MRPPLHAAIAVLAIAAVPSFGAVPDFVLSLDQAESMALERSPSVAAAEREEAAAVASARSAAAGLFPRIGLDGAVRYQDVVPEIRTGAAAMPLGDNESFSIGPSVTWQAWDSGAVYRRWKAARSLARARSADLDAARRGALLDVRLSYLDVRRAIEQVRLLADAVGLSTDQYKDISVRLKEGAGSRMDALSSHQELLTRQRQLRQAQSDLSVALRTLTRLTGLGDGVDPAVPLPDSVSRWPEQWQAPTMIVALDAIPDIRARLALPEGASLDEAHPAILALAERARSAEMAAASARSGLWPSILVSGRLSRDYPNGPIHETITQKTIGAAATWSLFDAGRVRGEARSAEKSAEAASFRRDDRFQALKADWNAGLDRRRGLLDQEKINRQAVDETEELARITYRAYLSGGASHLQVETANLRALEARVLQSQIEAQIAVQLAILNSLSAQGSNP